MDTKLLELLVCPVTKGPLDFDREKQELLSRSARLAYPVRDGIPVMLESEARALSDEELDALLQSGRRRRPAVRDQARTGLVRTVDQRGGSSRRTSQIALNVRFTIETLNAGSLSPVGRELIVRFGIGRNRDGQAASGISQRTGRMDGSL